MGELPVFTCQAHVFSINPQTKKSWVPASSKAVDVNFFFDTNKQCYRIISVEDGPGGKKVIINSTLTEKMTFKKTSQKFGQWADSKTGGVHGLGFNSENELTEFVNHFKQYVEASKGSVALSVTSNGRTTDIPVPTTVCSSLTASLGHPTVIGAPSSLNIITHATLVSSPPTALLSSPLISSGPGQLGEANSHLSYLSTHSSLQLQQQLRQAQNQVRRLEEELNLTKRQASLAGASLGANMSYNSEMISSAADCSGRSTCRSNSGDASEFSDCMSRLELNGTILNGAGEDCSTDGSSTLVHSLTAKLPGLPLSNLSRGMWTDRTNLETVRSLHARLGHILQEAVELHNRLGTLLPQVTPGAPPE